MRLVGEFKDIQDVKDLRVPTIAGGSVRLSEIAEVALDYPAPTKAVRLNTQTSIGLMVRKQSDANVVDTASRVKRELAALQSTLASRHLAHGGHDATKFINAPWMRRG